jgi:hypothetical protein
MADLIPMVEDATWVPQIHQRPAGEPLTGGAPDLANDQGFGNVQAQQLAKRTSWLKSKVGAATSVVAGILRTATQSEAEGSLLDTVAMTPLKVAQQIGFKTQDSLLETTAGKLLKVGSFGLGTGGQALPGNSVDLATATGFYYGHGSLHPTASAGGNPFPDLNGAFTLQTSGSSGIGGADEYISQFAVAFKGANDPRVKVRTRIVAANGWGPWDELWATANTPATLLSQGWQKLPNGLILQWGVGTTVSGDLGAGGTLIPFPTSFVSSCFHVFGADRGTSSLALGVGSFTASNFRAVLRRHDGVYSDNSFSYFAIGK